MQEIKITLDRANQLIRRADHMLYVTYPLLKDNKLIITMADNIVNGVLSAMDAVLMYEKLYKRISDYPEDFKGKIIIFKGIMASKYKIERDSIVAIEDLKNFLDERKIGNTEFTKNDKYMFFSQKQGIKSLGIDKIKQNLNISKELLRKVNGILSNVTTRF